MTKVGILAIFGPISPRNNPIVQSIAQNLEIPQFQNFWNLRLGPSNPTQQAPEGSWMIFNLFPEPILIAKALGMLLKEMRWKSFAILYQNDDGLVRLQEILKSRKTHDPPILVKKLQDTNDYRYFS